MEMRDRERYRVQDYGFAAGPESAQHSQPESPRTVALMFCGFVSLFGPGVASAMSLDSGESVMRIFGVRDRTVAAYAVSASRIRESTKSRV